MNKKFLLMTILLLLSTIIAACGGNNANGDTNEKKPSDETLVIYTNSGSDGRGDWLTEKADESGFSIKIVEGGGGEIVNRLIAEKNNPLADIVYGPAEADFNRLKDEEVKEIILATNPNIEGEATAMYISRLVKPSGIRTTRIAHGLPVGGDLEYADEVTLSKALEGRRDV